MPRNSKHTTQLTEQQADNRWPQDWIPWPHITYSYATSTEMTSHAPIRSLDMPNTVRKSFQLLNKLAVTFTGGHCNETFPPIGHHITDQRLHRPSPPFVTPIVLRWTNISGQDTHAHTHTHKHTQSHTHPPPFDCWWDVTSHLLDEQSQSQETGSEINRKQPSTPRWATTWCWWIGEIRELPKLTENWTSNTSDVTPKEFRTEVRVYKPEENERWVSRHSVVYREEPGWNDHLHLSHFIYGSTTLRLLFSHA